MRAAYRLTAVVAVVMGAQSALGLLFRSQYRDVEWITATWLGNDGVTLVVTIPLIAASMALARLGSSRALLLWLGALGYTLYNYCFYLFGAALNVFFPLYLSAVIGAAVALILGLSHIAPTEIARRFHAGTPVRLIGGYFVFVGISLTGIWLAIWAAYVFAGRQTPVDPEAFKLVAALDVVLVVPALVVGGALLWRRNAWGYVISAIAGIQGSLYLLVLTINSLIAVARGLTGSPGEVLMWSGLGSMTSAATSLLLANADTTNRHHQPPTTNQVFEV
jgi:hypothetical protein